MLTVDEQSKASGIAEKDASHLDRSVEFERIFNLAVKEAQEKNRRLGIPNYYEVNGRIVSDQDAPEEIATGESERSTR
jgi:hypothetical protein